MPTPRPIPGGGFPRSPASAGPQGSGLHLRRRSTALRIATTGFVACRAVWARGPSHMARMCAQTPSRWAASLAHDAGPRPDGGRENARIARAYARARRPRGQLNAAPPCPSAHEGAAPDIRDARRRRGRRPRFHRPVAGAAAAGPLDMPSARRRSVHRFARRRLADRAPRRGERRSAAPR